MIKFLGKKPKAPSKPWQCAVCATPNNRARGRDGIWANECVSCYAKFLKCLAAALAKGNPTWFLRGGNNKKETKP